VTCAHVELLLEELSAEAALRILLPRMLPPQITFNIHPFQGKLDLLGKLPQRLGAYAEWLPKDWRIVVLLDEDREDCVPLKRQLEGFALGAGLTTKSSPGADGSFAVLNRVAVEELEAWFFGDVQAMSSAYPGVPLTLGARSGFRDPDAIRGGTWEALQRVLQKAGHRMGGLRKVEAAEKIAAHMEPGRNRSRSLQCFASGLADIG